MEPHLGFVSSCGALSSWTWTRCHDKLLEKTKSDYLLSLNVDRGREGEQPWVSLFLHVYAVSKWSCLWFVLHLFPCAPSGFSTCPPDVLPHASVFLLTAAAVTNKLFRNRVPQWQQCAAAEWHLKKTFITPQPHAKMFFLWSCVWLLKSSRLLSFYPPDIQL